MTFKNGISGNPNGRPKMGSAFADQLRIEVAKKDQNGVTRLNKIVAALATKAEKGDVAAAREVADRLDGRVPIVTEDHKAERPIVIQMTELDLKTI